MPANRGDTPVPNWPMLDDVIWSLGENHHVTREPLDSIKAPWKLKNHQYSNQNQGCQNKFQDLNQFSWSMPIQGNKRLRDDLSDDPASLGTTRSGVNFWNVPWRDSMAPKHLSVSDFRPTQSPEFSVILKLRLNAEDGNNIEDSKRAKLGTCAFEYGVQGLCEADSIYQANNMEIVNSSCHFSLSDIDAPEGDLELYEEEQMGTNFLKHDWETSRSIEDMDRLLRLEELLWPPPPSGHVHSLSDMDVGHPSSDSFNKCSEGSGMNMEFILCGNLSPIPLVTTMDHDNKLWDSGNLEAFPDKPDLEHSLGEVTVTESLKKRKKLDRSQAGSQRMEDHSTMSGLDFDMTREFEKKPNKQCSEKTLSPESPVSAKAEFSSSLQSSFLSSGKVISPPTLLNLHHSFNTKEELQTLGQSLQSILYDRMGLEENVPIVMSKCTATSDQPQQSGYNHLCTFGDLSMKQYQNTVDVPSESMDLFYYMPPDENVEKLCCHKNMQNKTATSHQSYQACNQQQIHIQEKHISNQGVKNPEEMVTLSTLLSNNINSELQSLTRTSASKTEFSAEQEDTSPEATVLQKLQNSISHLSINTRLCIRDALYRLARSARQRRALDMSRSSRYNDVTRSELYDGLCGTESSDGDPIFSNERFLELNEIETETNQFDRSIANLLFQKCGTPPTENPESMGIPIGPLTNDVHPLQGALKAQNSFMWQRQTPSQTGLLIIPSSKETTLKDKCSGFSPLSIQFQDETSRSVIDNLASNTPLSFRNKKLQSIVPETPSEHLILSRHNFDNVMTEVSKNCHPLPCFVSLSNTDLSQILEV